MCAFPTSIEAATYFGEAYTNLATTLTQVAGISDTTIYVASTDNYGSIGWFTIEDETISYTGKTAGSFTGCTRGADNTTAAEHAAGKAVSLTLQAVMWNRAIAELRAALTKLGVNSSAVTTTHDYKLSGVTGTDKAVSLTGAETLTNKTINPVIKLAHTIVTATDGATVTFNLSLGNIQQVTLGGNRTLALSNVSVGQCFIINLIQDGTGSRTVTWFETIKWAGGSAPTLTTTAAKTDSLGFICVSAGYLGYIVGQNL
jgi:hypothetical protein